jgi:L-rhamnose-H+ transport protein
MNVVQAVALILIAAMMNATYTLPMKVQRTWRWEHSWCAFTVLGVAVVPTIVALLSVPHLWSIYALIPLSTLLMMLLFGAAWGVAQVFFGLSLPLVGIAVAFTISLSTSAASGSLLPLLTRHPNRLFTAQGAFLLSGIGLIVVGVSLCGRAGLQREGVVGKTEEIGPNRFLRGFLFSVISGVLGSLLNLGLAYGGQIQQAARDAGASEVMTSNAVWLPCVYAGFIPGAIYCVYLMRKQDVVSDFFGRARWYYWPGAASMGLLWYGSILVYALAASKLGEIGTAIGWPLFLSAIVVMSNIVGVLTSEWKPSATGPFRTLLAGLCCLLIAIVVVSQAGRITT